jgi:hypothetical protein
MSITRLIAPAGVTRSSSPWLESIGYSAPPKAIMEYQVPSGSKSSGSGWATGCAFWNALRFAISFHRPCRPTLITPFGTPGRPCEQPAPDSSAYSRRPMNATADTPLTTPPTALLARLEGSASTTVDTTPDRLTRAIRPPSRRLCVLPVYGAAAPAAWRHRPTVE